MEALGLLLLDPAFARSLLSDSRIFRQATLVEEGKKLLVADPTALMQAVHDGDVTQVRRFLAACPSTPDHRARTRNARTPARPTPLTRCPSPHPPVPFLASLCSPFCRYSRSLLLAATWR